ncbi:MAG: hypothetical protein HKN08_13285 [Gammaproteobacteria bacterium]|nr:hypothetical protein [Gammaproteobacteria bacterium]
MYKFNDFKLGETEDEIEIESSEDNISATNAMVIQASRKIDIISRKLDPVIYDTPEFIEAIKQLILKSSRAKVRVLVFEPEQIVKRGHRLVSLSMDMSSYITINVPNKEHAAFNESLLIADAAGYIYRKESERFEGKVNFNDKRASRFLIHEFDQMWEKSRSDPYLRRALL